MPEGTIAADDQLYPTLRTVNLSQLCGSARFQELDKLEAYYRCKQYEGRRYDWDGRMRGYGQAADISPGWYVPLKLRRPSARYDLARLIVRRLTSMVFGAERFPQLVVDGDDDAQDYVRALAEAAKLSGRLQELRNKGGAQGAAGASFGFVDGRPRIKVHNAKHITVLKWADRDAFRPAEVLESYSYPRTVWDASGKPKQVTMYFARYWSEQEEVTWDPIPEEIARQAGWENKIKRTVIEHGYGFCPFYWVQNLPDCDATDGDSDFEGMCDVLDEINTLLSATTKGTVANVDPTLVIHSDPQKNTGTVRKGSENAIYSEKGAKYLELTGESLKAGLALLQELKMETLDTVGVVLGDPDKMAASVASAAALRMLYLPMTTQADLLREQYGEFTVQLMTGMLQAAKMIEGQAPGEIVVTDDGQRMQQKPTVTLPQKVTTSESGEKSYVDRTPGETEVITLNWPPYFPNTWADTKQAVEATQAARGQGAGAIISRKTATENVAPLFGIADVDQEMDAIEGDRAEDMAFMQESMRVEGEGEPGGKAGSEDNTGTPSGE